MVCGPLVDGQIILTLKEDLPKEMRSIVDISAIVGLSKTCIISGKISSKGEKAKRNGETEVKTAIVDLEDGEKANESSLTAYLR
jgi:hypothetical protein